MNTNTEITRIPHGETMILEKLGHVTMGICPNTPYLIVRDHSDDGEIALANKLVTRQQSSVSPNKLQTTRTS